jgi:hypothetical protein
MKKISGFVLLFSAFCSSCANATLADVPTHQALTLYGNAALGGLCRFLGTNRQLKMVCNVNIYAQPEFNWKCEYSFQDVFRMNGIDAPTAMFSIQQCKLNPDEEQSE